MGSTPAALLTQLSAVTFAGNTAGQVALAATLAANLQAAVAALGAANSPLSTWVTGQPWIQVPGYQSAFTETDRLSRLVIVYVPPSPGLVATVNSTFGITGSGQSPAPLAFDTNSATFSSLTNRADVALSVAGAGVSSSASLPASALAALVGGALANVTSIWTARPSTTAAQDAALSAANSTLANAMSQASGFLSSLGFS